VMILFIICPCIRYRKASLLINRKETMAGFIVIK